MVEELIGVDLVAIGVRVSEQRACDDGRACHDAILVQTVV